MSVVNVTYLTDEELVHSIKLYQSFIKACQQEQHTRKQKAELEKWSAKRFQKFEADANRAFLRRCRVIRARIDGKTFPQIAKQERVSPVGARTMYVRFERQIMYGEGRDYPADLVAAWLARFPEKVEEARRWYTTVFPSPNADPSESMTEEAR